MNAKKNYINKKTVFVVVLSFLLCVYFTCAAYIPADNLMADKTIPSNMGFHELRYISNGTEGYSIDINQDGIIDLADNSITTSTHCGNGIDCTFDSGDTYGPDDKIFYRDSPIWVGSWVASPTKAVLELITGNRVEDEIMLGGNGTGGDYTTGLIKLQADNTKIYGNLNITGDIHVGVSSLHYSAANDLLQVGALKLTGPGAPSSCNVAANASGDFMCETGSMSGWTINGNNIYSALSGNVGIGTNIPSYKLHVVGDTNIEGNLYANDFYGDDIYIDNAFITNSLNVTNIYGDTIEGDTFLGDDIFVTNLNSTTIYGDTFLGDTFLGDTIIVNNMNVTSINVTNINIEGAIYQGGDIFVTGYWNETGTNIWYIDGNVGVGTATPASTLDINGIVRAQQLCDEAGANCKDISAGWAMGKWIDGAVAGEIYYSAGDVGIGTNAPSQALDVNGNIVATAYYYSSDVSLKEDIILLDSALDKVLALEGVSFKWKEDGKESIGLIAQDVEKVYPELVFTDDKDEKSVQYGNLIAPLIEAVKSQQKMIENQQRQINDLKGEIENLKE